MYINFCPPPCCRTDVDYALQGLDPSDTALAVSKSFSEDQICHVTLLSFKKQYGRVPLPILPIGSWPPDLACMKLY